MILLFPPVLQKRRGKLGGPLDYLIDWVLFRVDEPVRRLVELASDSQQPFQLLYRITGQQGPIRSRCPKSQGSRPRLYSKVYGRAGTRHKYPDGLVRDPTGARSNYSRSARDARSSLCFELAKAGFSVFREYARDRFTGGDFDVTVEVNKRYAEFCRDRLPYRGLTGAREPDKKYGH